MHKYPGKEIDGLALDQSSSSDGEVDAGTSSERVLEDEMTAAVGKFVQHRSTIEQTKGMLMLVYGIDESTAFELLRWRSQQNNVKLRPLAEQIAADFLALTKGETHPRRSAYDGILLNAHQRIEGETPSRDGVALSSADQHQLALKTGRATP
jgi:hypothetical protein